MVVKKTYTVPHKPRSKNYPIGFSGKMSDNKSTDTKNAPASQRVQSRSSTLDNDQLFIRIEQLESRISQLEKDLVSKPST